MKLVPCAQVAYVGLILALALAGAAQAAPLQISVDASQITSDATFFSSPAETVSNPVPYGVANNASDNGWILDSGGFTVDFGSPVALQEMRFWSSFASGARAAVWDIERSSDGVGFTQVAQYTYSTSVGGGVDDSGNPTSDTTGWYAATFNAAGDTDQFWRVHFDHVVLPDGDHSPRTAEVQFFTQVLSVPEPTSCMLLVLACLAALPGAVRRFRRPAE